MRRANLAFIFMSLLLTGVSGVRPIDVDQVEFEGVTALSQSQVEEAMAITAGDRLDQSRVNTTVTNLVGLYKANGYEAARVRVDLVRQKGEGGNLDVILRFRIDEGLPTRVAEVVVVTANSLEEPTLRDLLLLKSGDVILSAKVTQTKERILNELFKREYLSASLDQIKISDVPVPNAEAAAATRWVKVEFVVDTGSRMTFGFRGNQEFSNGDLDDLIDEQRATGFSKDFIQTLRDRIEEKYRSSGYTHAKVKPYTFQKPDKPEMHVRYEIEEGPKVQIDRIDFDGNFVFSDADLTKVYMDRGSALIAKKVYVDKDVDQAAEVLVDWIRSNGYLAAKLVTVNRRFKDSGKRVDLTVYLYEGEQTVVREIKIEGTPLPGTLEPLGVKEGAPLNLFTFNAGLENMKIRFRSAGYLDFRIANEDENTVILYSRNNRQADIRLILEEGPRYRIGSIQILGLKDTKDKVVRRELQFQEEDFVESEHLTVTESRLRKLGLFSSVAVQFRDDPARPGYKEVRILLKEGEAGLVEGGIGIRNDLGIRIFGNISYANVMQENHTVSLSASANRRFENFCAQRGNSATPECFIEYQARVDYVWPWFFMNEMVFTPSVTQSLRRYNQFDANSTAMELTFIKPLFKGVGLTAALTYSLERTRQFNSTNSIDNQTLTIGALIPSLTLDRRDNALAPSKGFYGNASFEWAHPVLGSQTDPYQVGYLRAQFRGDQFVPIGNRIILYVSFRTGWERNILSPFGIPLSKQFALGGVSSLRGFTFQELNAQSTIVTGFMTFVNYRSQLDFAVTRDFRLGPFLDAGNLQVDAFSLGNLRAGAGFGIHYQTPVGPVNLDLGFKLNPQPGEDTSRFYFSVGIL